MKETDDFLASYRAGSMELDDPFNLSKIRKAEELFSDEQNLEKVNQVFDRFFADQIPTPAPKKSSYPPSAEGDDPLESVLKRMDGEIPTPSIPEFSGIVPETLDLDGSFRKVMEENVLRYSPSAEKTVVTADLKKHMRGVSPIIADLRKRITKLVGHELSERTEEALAQVHASCAAFAAEAVSGELPMK